MPAASQLFKCREGGVMVLRACTFLAALLLSACLTKQPFPTTLPPDHLPIQRQALPDKASARTFALRSAQDTSARTGVYARVVDTGQALCVVVVDPLGYALVYDTGHWSGSHCAKAVESIVGPGAPLSLMILSHSDADHLGDTARILDRHDVDTIIWTGDRAKEPTKTWLSAAQAIGRSAASGTTVYSLQTHDIPPGTAFELGAMTVTIVAGWGSSPWGGLDPSDTRNVISVVARVTYGDSSLLLAGDTIGRNRGLDNSTDACESAEQFMVTNALSVPIQSDVLVAPHHGANNGSSNCFIREVDPKWVIFSAGSGHGHPRQLAVDRYLEYGVLPERMLRLDRGDAEGKGEWIDAESGACTHQAGDDDVEVLMPAAGEVVVSYAVPNKSCG